MKFENLNFNRKILKQVSFFPSLAMEDGTIVGIDLKDESALDVVVELMDNYGVPMGILFTKDKKINVIARFEDDDISVFEKDLEEVKREELSEMLIMAEVNFVIIAEELNDNGLAILSNRSVIMKDEGDDE